VVRAKNAGSDCCHCGDCAILADSFTRSDSTNIGPDWVESTGNWEILSNELKANNAGIVYTVTTWNKTRRVASVIARDALPGKTYRLLFSVSNDGSSYAYVELECLTGNVAFIRFGTSAGGVIEEFEFVYNEGLDYTLIACVNDEGTYVGLAEVSWPLWTCDTFPGPRAGIQNIGSAAEYDDFGFYKHVLDTDGTDLRCHTCACECSGKCLRRDLTLTIESSCVGRDGMSMPLTLQESFYPDFVWEGEAEWPDISGETTQIYHFRLFCANADDTFILCSPEYMGACSTDTWDGDAVGCGGGIFPDRGRFADSVVCDPLELRFGPGDCGLSPPPDPPPACTETVVITA
jgi:hypothetical protein